MVRRYLFRLNPCKLYEHLENIFHTYLERIFHFWKQYFIPTRSVIVPCFSAPKHNLFNSLDLLSFDRLLETRPDDQTYFDARTSTSLFGFFGVNDWPFVQNWNPEEWFNLNCLLLSNCPGWSLAADLRSVPSSIEHNIIAHHFFRADKNIWMYPRWPCIWLLEWCCWNSCIGKIFVRFSGTPAPEKAWVISFLKTNRSKYRFPSKNQILAPDPPVEEEISASNQFQIVLTIWSFLVFLMTNLKPSLHPESLGTSDRLRD